MNHDGTEPEVDRLNALTKSEPAEWVSHAGAAGIAMAEHVRRVLIVGAGENGRILAQQLQSLPGFVVVGFVEDDPCVGECVADKILGGHDDVFRIIDEMHIDEVVVAYAPSWQQRVAESLVNGRSHLRVKVVPTLYETMIAKPQFKTVDDVPLIHLTAPQGLTLVSRFVKRTFDIVASLIIMILLLPVISAAALAIKLTSSGPILFRQERVGYNGRLFDCMKFRTMVVDAEARTGPVLSSGKADDRVTPVGRFLRKSRVDEIPQFLNVLLGQMSIVGPRPERTVFVEQFRKDITGYDERHKVRPGITGLAQVHGYYLTDVHTKLRYDLMYVYNQSLLLDIKILCQTVREMVVGSGS